MAARTAELDLAIQRVDRQADKALQQLREHEGEAKEMKKRVEGVETTLPKKAERRDLMQLKADLKNFCEYKDLKELYGKVMPPLQRIGQNLEALETDMNRNMEIIRRFDEVLLDKASKVSV